MLRGDKRRELDDPEIEAAGVRRRIEKGVSSSSGHRASAPEYVSMAMPIDVPAVVDMASGMDIEAMFEKQVGRAWHVDDCFGPNRKTRG